MNDDVRLRRSRAAEFRRVGEEVIRVQLNDDAVELDGVAALLWRLFDGSRSLGEIVASVSSQYGVSTDMVRADVVDFAIDMAGRCFLVVAPA